MTASSDPWTSAFKHDVERRRLARLDLGEDVLQLGARLDAGVTTLVAHAQPVVASLTDDAGGLLVRRGAELVTGLGHGRQTEHLDRRRRTGRLHLLALVVDHRPHAAPGRAGHDRVADVELALVDEDRGDGTPTDVELGLEHDALGPPVRVGPELLELGHDEQLVEQVVDAEVLGRRHLDDDRVAAPRLGNQLVLGQLAEDALRVGVVLVDLVHGHDDRHLGRLGVVDRLDRLGHHAVVSGDDEHDDVRRVGTAGAHLRERGVARRVEERDPLPVLLDLVGADVLGDARRPRRRRRWRGGSCPARSSCRGRRGP